MTGRARTAAEQRINDLVTELCQHTLGSLPAPVIGAYLAHDGEVNLRDFLAGTHHMTALPRVSDEHLRFYSWHAGQPLQNNQWGIAEPLTSSHEVQLAQIDLLLVPLVAFDTQGTRLGMGGGYYDRFLASDGTARIRPHLVGVAFACQQSPELLPQAEWDIPLDTVVSENGVLNCRS